MRKVVTRYAKRGEVNLAYQAIGQGAFDVVLVPGFPSNLEILWENPGFVHLVKRLTAFCRLILFDPRGVGLSDGLDLHALPDTQARAGDILAVMDAAGSGRAALIGASDGAAPAILVAATQPARCRALVLHGGYACFLGSVLDAKAQMKRVDTIEATWGTGGSLLQIAPGRAEDRALADWWGSLERLSASPTTAKVLMRMFGGVDVRDALSAVNLPTLMTSRFPSRTAASSRAE